MEPVYIDLHIHTSEDPANLSQDYDIDLLVKKIAEYTGNSKFLISLTDHNVINKAAYMKAKAVVGNLLLGVELHVTNYSDAPRYHCHIYFKAEEITEEIIDDINKRLHELYPNKVITDESPHVKIQDIIQAFDSYDFLLLPHGGQSHGTFNTSIPVGTIFDDRMNRAFYYNQFDGFTARNEKKLEKGIDYFEKLKIREFVNLITCTDNYEPQNYPLPKDPKSTDFLPTWMLAEPTFNGLRLSLSESSRLAYGKKPESWSTCIEKVILNHDKIKIDVDLTPGLNVVIGGSSSGKTLFVDSVHRKITNNFAECPYIKNYGVEQIEVINPTGKYPHYIPQSYITDITNRESDSDISDISILKNVFPGDDEINVKIKRTLREFHSDLQQMITCVKTLEDCTSKIKKISILSGLITSKLVQENILKGMFPSQDERELVYYGETDYESDISTLKRIDDFLKNNPLITHDEKIIDKLGEELKEAYKNSEFEKKIYQIIKNEKNNIDTHLRTEDAEHQSKKQEFDELKNLISTYSKTCVRFKTALDKISKYDVKYESEKITSSGHTLYIENKFTLNKNVFVEIINEFLRTGEKISSFSNIHPENLFADKWKKRDPVVRNHEDLANKIYSKLEGLNKRKYKITTNADQDFESLSAGWQTSIILDIILGYENDLAPLIIDQPEDNLATKYINEGLVRAIKNNKSKKQIIMVSHNATIPMLGDAQNVVLCKNEGNQISIVSAALEGKIDQKDVVDHIAEITDGGKISIKKRVKKYNLKKFNE